MTHYIESIEYEQSIEESIDGNQINDTPLYKSSDFISKPIKSERCTMDENILQLQYPLLKSNRFFYTKTNNV
jgi:hypothetical protein